MGWKSLNRGDHVFKYVGQGKYYLEGSEGKSRKDKQNTTVVI